MPARRTAFFFVQRLVMMMLSLEVARWAMAWGPRSSLHARQGYSILRLVRKEPFSSISDDRSSDDSVLDPLVVCGPSGVGKGTIIAKYMEELGGKDLFGFTVSHTTRAPRPGEVPGVHYHFVSQDEMKAAIRQGLFLEHAEVHGNLYGTSWQSLRNVSREGRKRALLDIDVQGVKKLRLLEEPTVLEPKYVFIAPPSLEVLEARLIGRGTETAESLARRTKNAREEMDYGLQDGNFDAIVVNDDLDESSRDFLASIRILYPDLS